MHGGRDRIVGRQRRIVGRGGAEGSGSGGWREAQEGIPGDEGEELVMVMRRCNDSSAIRSRFVLPHLLFLVSLSLSLCFLSDLTLYLRSTFVWRWSPGPLTHLFTPYCSTERGCYPARVAISPLYDFVCVLCVCMCVCSARACIRRIMGRLLTLNTVNNSQWRRTICSVKSLSLSLLVVVQTSQILTLDCFMIIVIIWYPIICN